jgi:hypothetical protein
VKEKRVPQVRQNPSVLAGEPSRPRPTGSLQLAQKRWLSPTVGLAMSADVGSRYGTDGTSTKPAPSRRLAASFARVVPDRLSAAVAEPPACVLGGVAVAVAGPPVCFGVAVADGPRAAMPQVSQYPSVIWPVQPGCVQLI